MCVCVCVCYLFIYFVYCYLLFINYISFIILYIILSVYKVSVVSLKFHLYETPFTNSCCIIILSTLEFSPL